MSGVLLPRRGGGSALLPTRLNRELEAGAMVRAHKVQAVNFVGSVALNAVAQLSTTQAELAKLAPGSELRLAAIADSATVAIQATVMNMALEA